MTTHRHLEPRWVDAAASVGTSRPGNLVTAATTGCAAIGIWNLALASSLSLWRSASHWAFRINEVYAALLRGDVDPTRISVGFRFERLSVAAAVAAVAYALVRRRAQSRLGQLVQALIFGTAIVAAPWILNAEGIGIAIYANSAPIGKGLAIVLPAVCMSGAAVGLALILGPRRRLGVVVATAVGAVSAAAIYWLRSPVDWMSQAVCGTGVVVLLALAWHQSAGCRQHEPSGGS